MTRRESREQALALVFSMMFNGDVPPQEICELSKLSLEFQDDEFSQMLFDGVCENLESIDNAIEKCMKTWNKNRISKVSLAVLRLAIFEILYIDDIPASVSINEAIELAKKFASDDDAAFVNGILGSVTRNNEA
ncbi:MAG: transcription antitermination factor NusB [Clostridia bacterium]|nr:transcription antitermination factor NusB [Clostridia bacterium]